MNIFQEISTRNHEQVSFFSDKASGLRAIIAVHNTVLGPGLGGCRMRLYQSEAEALDDVLRLSEGMTYKSALAGLDLGGGKACIIADHRMTDGREDLFRAFGKAVQMMSGRYVTAEDMGTSVSDMAFVQSETEFVTGCAPGEGGSGDPSPWTALGVFQGIRAALAFRFGTEDLGNRRIAVQGVGHVGEVLTKLLREAGAQVTVTDTSESTLSLMKEQYGVSVVGLNEIYDVECDVYAPCAVGQTVTTETLARLKAGIIAGAANNQLLDATVNKMILDRNIVYCPDFAINAGGVISVGAEYLNDTWNEEWVREKVLLIGQTIEKILQTSKSSGESTEDAALKLARERIDQKKH